YWVGFLLALGFAVAWSPRNRPFAIVGATTLLLIAVPLRVVLWMPGGRLLLPAVALCLCALVAVADATAPRRRRFGWAAAVVVAALLVSPLTPHVRRYDQRHSVLPGNGAERAASHLGRHAPEGAWLVTRDAGVVPFFVGTGVHVAELHPQALTQPHPNGGKADYAAYVPQNPAFFVAVVRTADQKSFTYGDAYLGRVHQHHRRHYDVWVRADLDIPPLPEAVVVTKRSP
ncbi:MAG: hypothetical protein JRI25_29425, partial [Deltaproteobacteria bacterium]|nr:hypothetical protein [Deltaproteobacteria bacterium]